MKYLTNCPELRQSLPGINWQVIDFFFDFRLKQEIGNSMEGLLRSLLSQIFERVPGLPEKALRPPGGIPNSIEAWKTLFNVCFNSIHSQLFVLIDGLDEYTGNLRLLSEFLLTMSHYSNIKLCLASRPNSTIELMLPSRNLRMSDHNLEGIREYILLATRPFEARLDGIDWSDLRSSLEDRAEGVFLWVYFVVEEVIKACIDGEGPKIIQARLDDLPDELDQLYQRMLDGIPRKQEVEAAILYTLINETSPSLNLTRLWSAFIFLKDQGYCGDGITLVSNLKAFRRRLQSVLGSFLHFQNQEDDLQNEEMDCTKVQLMHRTVKSFMSDSAWCTQRLPSSFLDSFPDQLCTRLAAKALEAGDARLGCHLDSLLDKAGSRFVSLKTFQDIIREMTSDTVLERWSPLLHFSISCLLPLCSKFVEEEGNHPDITKIAVDMLRARLATLHFAFSWHHCHSRVNLCPPIKCLGPDVADLMIAAGHGLLRYLRINSRRVATLSDIQRDWILIQGTYGNGVVACEGYHAFSRDWEYELIKMVLPLQQKITSFHVALVVILRTGDIGELSDLVRSRVPTSFDYNVRPPEWNWFLGKVMDSGHLLFVWACDHLVAYDDDGALSSYREVVLEAQLDYLLSLGMDINEENQQGKTIVQHIIITHLFGHIFGGRTSCVSLVDELPSHYPISNLLKKIYLIEKKGAIFEVSSGCETIMSAFHHHRKRSLHRMLQIKNKDLDTSLVRLWFTVMDELQFMLTHKQATGHLPRPMVSADDLWHYLCKPRKRCLVCAGEEPDIEDKDQNVQLYCNEDCLCKYSDD